MYTVVFKLERSEEVILENITPGKDNSLLDMALDNDININSLCGGAGICKSCLLHVEEGSEFFEKESCEEGENNQITGRYACQSFLLANKSGRVIVNINT